MILYTYLILTDPARPAPDKLNDSGFTLYYTPTKVNYTIFSTVIWVVLTKYKMQV